MRNFCYELGKVLRDHVNSKEIYFASHVTTVNDLRSALSGLKELDDESAAQATMLLEELEHSYRGKALFRQVDDIRGNLSGVLALFLRMRGEKVPEEEAEVA